MKELWKFRVRRLNGWIEFEEHPDIYGRVNVIMRTGDELAIKLYMTTQELDALQYSIGLFLDAEKNCSREATTTTEEE